MLYDNSKTVHVLDCPRKTIEFWTDTLDVFFAQAPLYFDSNSGVSAYALLFCLGGIYDFIFFANQMTNFGINPWG